MVEQQDEMLLDVNEIMEKSVCTASSLMANKPDIAEVILKQVLKCDPEHHSALQLLGLCKHRLGENAEAIEILQSVIENDPTNADNWNNLGLAYSGIENYKKSVECIEKAVELNPNQPLYKNNLSLQYRGLGDHEKSIACMIEALESHESPQMWLNLGGIYGEVKDIESAEKCFANALKLQDNYAAAYIDLAFCYHLKGDWKKGFAAYEWRFLYYPQMRHYLGLYDMSKKWDGKADLNGKRVLVYGEQGLGDIINFSRFLPLLKARGAYVILHCSPNLEPVMRRMEGVDEVINWRIDSTETPEFPEYDYQFALMSAPYLLDVQEISGSPYITPATNAFRGQMKEKYGDTFNVGILWAGSPSHPNDKSRSIPLKCFRPLNQIPGVSLFSLQMDSAKRQYGVTCRNVDESNPLFISSHSERFQPSLGVVDYNEGCDDMKVTDLTNMIQTFEDTATILAGLDLVICCDTSTAHLAGAMGVPVWVALPFNADWRWTLTGDKTFWYDSMRLYRQTERGDWDGVFKRIQEDLNEVVLQNKR